MSPNALNHGPQPRPSDAYKFVAPPPIPQPPDAAARERFAKRRNAVQIADAMARIVGRAPAEAGTARLALILAAESGVAPRSVATEKAPPSKPTSERQRQVVVSMLASGAHDPRPAR